MTKKRILSMVSIMLILSMLMLAVGCGSKDDADENDATGSNETSNTGTGSSEPSTPASYVSDKKITLKILTGEWAGIQVGNDMPVYQELEKKTNVHLEFQLLPLTNPLEKFNLIMASNELPDIVGWSSDAKATEAILKYAKQGAFISLQDLIKEHAPDIVKALDNPLANDKLPWAELTADDGNIYTVPGISSSNAIGAVYAMRTDWLAKLNLKAPETSDDLYNVLKAFKENDPNGNKQKDEIPFIAGAGGKTLTVLPVINAFDAHMDLYVDKSSNTIKYGPVEQNYKEGLAFLNKLYKEKLLEEDYLTATRDQWLARATGNEAGFMFVWPAGGIGTATKGLQKLNKDYKFEPIPPFKSKSGAQYKDTKTAGQYLFYSDSITSSNKYPVETIKYLNFCFTDEGLKLASYGIEGVHHNMVNGKPIYTDLILKNPEGIDPELARIKDGINWTCLPYQIGWDSEFQAMQASPWVTKSWEYYRESGMVEAPMPALKFTDAEFSKRTQIITEIDTYKDAMIDKFIMGVESLDKFDDFVASINKAGLEELLKIQNDAYKRYQEFGK